MSLIQILEYTDPVCPFAWSAEPARRRIEWLYGDALSLAPRMVGLHASGAEMEAHGFDPEKLARGQAKLAHAHHMPMSTEPPPRLAGSMLACRAVVATRLNDPPRERAVLRALRVRNFAGDLVDELETIRAAGADVGIDPDAIAEWVQDPTSERVLRDDMAASRMPSAEGLALAHKLAETEDGDHRYTCPSWEIAEGDRSITVPGFQPLAAYEVAIANVAPALKRRDDPDDVAEVLTWAGEPLATAEVAAVCAIELDEARERLGRVAAERHIGFDGLWSLS